MQLQAVESLVKFFDNVPKQIKSLLVFHIHFTVRSILFEMGGILSESVLPGDPTFNQINYDYDTPSFTQICVEFGILSSTDFRFKEGDNHGLGSVLIYATNPGSSATSFSYLGHKFGDEGGKAIKFNLIYFIGNDNKKAEWQFNFFMADKSECLT